MDTYLELIRNYIAKEKAWSTCFFSVVEIVLIRYVTFLGDACQVQKCTYQTQPLGGVAFFMKGEPIWVDEDLCLIKTRHVSHEC